MCPEGTKWYYQLMHSIRSIVHQRGKSSHHLDHQAQNAVAPPGRSSGRNPQRTHRRLRGGSPTSKNLLRSSRSALPACLLPITSHPILTKFITSIGQNNRMDAAVGDNVRNKIVGS